LTEADRQLVAHTNGLALLPRLKAVERGFNPAANTTA